MRGKERRIFFFYLETTPELLWWEQYTGIIFVATKHVFGHHKSMLVVTKSRLL